MRKIKMPRQKQLVSSLVALVIAVGGGTWINLVGASGTASLYLSPASGSHNINTTFNVVVYENSGSEAVNTVVANLTYDQAKLQFVSLNTSGSPFNTCPEASGGNGSIRITCAKLAGSTTGNQLVGTISFKALAGSGNTSVSFASDSHIARASDSSDIWNGDTTGGTYSFTTPAPPATPTPTPTQNTGSNNSSNTIPKTNTSPTPSTTTTTAQQANPDAPVPVSKNTATNQGYIVAIKVTDNAGKPVKDARVELADQTSTTDADGMAGFVNVPAGDHIARIHSVLGDSTHKVTVDANSDPTKVQQFETKLEPEKSNLAYIPILLFGLLILAGIGLTLFRKRTGRFPWVRTKTSVLPPRGTPDGGLHATILSPTPPPSQPAVPALPPADPVPVKPTPPPSSPEEVIIRPTEPVDQGK